MTSRSSHAASPSTTRQARRAVTASLALAVLMLGLMAPALAGNHEPKVTICHATDAAENPYNALDVAHSAVDGEGQNDHTLHSGPVFDPQVHDQQNRGWGDIIPPVDGVTGGLNWPAGQAIWDNGCALPKDEEEPDPGSGTVAKEWTGDDFDDSDLTVTLTTSHGELAPDDEVELDLGETLTVTAETVTGLADGCTYDSDLPDDGASFTATENEPDGTITVTNTVTCDEVAGVTFAFDAVCEGTDPALDYGVELEPGQTPASLELTDGERVLATLDLRAAADGRAPWPTDDQGAPVDPLLLDVTVDDDVQVDDHQVTPRDCGGDDDTEPDPDDTDTTEVAGERRVASEETEVLGTTEETLPRTGASVQVLTLAGLLSLLLGLALTRRRPRHT